MPLTLGFLCGFRVWGILCVSCQTLIHVRRTAPWRTIRNNRARGCVGKAQCGQVQLCIESPSTARPGRYPEAFNKGMGYSLDCLQSIFRFLKFSGPRSASARTCASSRCMPQTMACVCPAMPIDSYGRLHGLPQEAGVPAIHMAQVRRTI